MPVARARVGVGGAAVDAAEAAGGEDHGPALDALHAPTHEIPCRHADAAIAVEHQVEREPLVVDGDAALDQLLVQHVQQDVAGDVGRVAGARRAAGAERALGDLAVLGAAEHSAHVLQLVDVAGPLLAHHLDRVLVAQVVRALDGEEGVLVGVVLAGVAERRVDAALGRPRVAPRGVQLGHDSDVGAVPRCLDGGAHPSEACAHHHHVVSNHQRLRKQGWSQQPSAYQAGPSGRVACDSTWGILDQGAVEGYGRAVTIPGRNLGEDGLCVAGGAARSSESVAARAARPDASDAQQPAAPTTALRTSRHRFSRSKASTFIVSDDPAGEPHQAIDRDEWERVSGCPGRVHRRAGDDRRRRVHRQRPRPARPGTPLHRGLKRQHRRHAGRPVLPRRARRRRRLRSRAGRHLHAQPPDGRLPRRPPDRGQPRSQRHPRLQLRLLRRVEEGRAANVEQARPGSRRPGAARRLQGDSDAERATGSA